LSFAQKTQRRNPNGGVTEPGTSSNKAASSARISYQSHEKNEQSYRMPLDKKGSRI
jgi:hypothetical protein